MLNKIIIMGLLGRDPELRYTQGGTPVASFSLAVDRDFKDKASGERVTDWIEIVAWSAKAKFVKQYFQKGQMATVDGRLQVRDWVDQNGGKRRTYEVLAENIYFAGTKAQSPGGDSFNEQRLSPADTGEFRELADDGEELPF